MLQEDKQEGERRAGRELFIPPLNEGEELREREREREREKGMTWVVRILCSRLNSKIRSPSRLSRNTKFIFL